MESEKQKALTEARELVKELAMSNPDILDCLKTMLIRERKQGSKPKTEIKNREFLEMIYPYIEENYFNKGIFFKSWRGESTQFRYEIGKYLLSLERDAAGQTLSQEQKLQYLYAVNALYRDGRLLFEGKIRMSFEEWKAYGRPINIGLKGYWRRAEQKMMF